MVAICTCGRRYSQHAPAVPMAIGSKTPKQREHTGPTSCPVNMNAYICRQCPSGKYDAARDACVKVIQIGLDKKPKPQKRAGKINWLHYHADAKCPLGHF